MDFKKEYIDLLAKTHTREELAQMFVEAKEKPVVNQVAFDWNVIDTPSPLLYKVTQDAYHAENREYAMADAVMSEPLADYLVQLGFIIINR